MQKHFVGFLIMIFAAIGLINLTGQIFAQADIQYPVTELGNCQDQADCKSYCDKQENTKACVNFAEKNNLMSEEEIQIAKNFIAAGSKGPGGCTGKDSCEEYCNDINHIDACILFAEKNNLMSPAELDEAKKVQAAIAKGVKPPPCGNKKACDAYCDAPEHMEECITFGAAAGFIQGKELEDAQKMLQAIKRGAKPPPCKGKDACDEYCSTPENMEVCMNFAMEAGFMNEQEKADAQKMLQAIKKGVKPPNCKNKEECDVYCNQEEHFEECTNFAEAAGFMTAEEAAMARKTGGKGPGGCKGKDECEAFCNNPDNQETCFNFAKDNGLIPEEDLRQMEQGRQQLQESLQQAPQAVIDCLQSEVGQDMVEKMKSGTALPPKEIGEKMQGCFQQMGPPPGEVGGPGAGGMMPPAGQTGPGGCTSEEECRNYCESNPEQCQNLQPPTQPIQGGSEPGFAPMPCEGDNCPQPPPAPDGGAGSAPPPPCESGNCPLPPDGQQYQPQPGEIPMQPGQYVPPSSGEIMPPPQESPQPSPSTAPGEGGAMTPGVFVPPALPSEPAPAPSSEPAPPAEQQPPSSFLDPSNLLGAAVNTFREFLFGVNKQIVF